MGSKSGLNRVESGYFQYESNCIRESSVTGLKKNADKKVRLSAKNGEAAKVYLDFFRRNPFLPKTFCQSEAWGLVFRRFEVTGFFLQSEINVSSRAYARELRFFCLIFFRFNPRNRMLPEIQNSALNIT